VKIFFLIFIVYSLGSSDEVLVDPGKYLVEFNFKDKSDNEMNVFQRVIIYERLNIFSWKSENDTCYGCFGKALIFNAVEDLNSVLYNGVIIFDKCLSDSVYFNLHVSKNKPLNVKRCSKKFNSLEWVDSVYFRYRGNEYNINFIFPLIQDMNNKYNFFEVGINDSMNFEFVFLDSTVIGNVINNTGRTRIFARDAFNLLLAENKFYLKVIQIKGLYKNIVSEYLNFDLNVIDRNAEYYGIDF